MDAFWGVNRRCRRVEEEARDTGSGAFADLKRSITRQWLRDRPARVFRNTRERTAGNHSARAAAKTKTLRPVNTHPIPFVFSKKHDQIWLVRAFDDELASDKVVALVWRGGEMWMPLAWLPQGTDETVDNANPDVGYTGSLVFHTDLEAQAMYVDEHSGSLLRIAEEYGIVLGPALDEKETSPAHAKARAAVWRAASKRNPAALADDDIMAEEVSDIIDEIDLERITVPGKVQEFVGSGLKMTEAKADYAAAARGAARARASSRPQMVVAYRCVKSVSAVGASIEGRVLHRQAVETAEDGRVAGLINAAVVERYSSGDRAFIDPLTGNTYCASCSEGKLPGRRSAAMHVVASAVQEPGRERRIHRAVARHVVACLGGAFGNRPATFPTKAIWDSKAFRTFYRYYGGTDLGFAKAEEKTVPLVAAGMTAGSRAPNVYRVLAEHNTDTAKAGLASTASFLGSATHNVLDYAYRLYGGVQHDQSVDVIRTYPAVTAAIGVVAYDAMSSYLARDPAVTRATLAADVRAGETSVLPVPVGGRGAVILRPDHVLRKAGKVAAAAMEFKTVWGRRDKDRQTMCQYKAQALLQALAAGAGRAILHIVRCPYEREPGEATSTIWEASMDTRAPGYAYACELAVAVVARLRAVQEHRGFDIAANDTSVFGTAAEQADAEAQWVAAVDAVAGYRASDKTARFSGRGSSTLVATRRAVAAGWREVLDRVMLSCFVPAQV